jgi:hypothetical protein
MTVTSPATIITIARSCRNVTLCIDEEWIFYDEFDGRRRKRVLVKILGD